MTNAASDFSDWWERGNGRALTELPQHVKAIAEKAYATGRLSASDMCVTELERHVKAIAEKAYAAGRLTAADRCADIIHNFIIGPKPETIQADKNALIGCVQLELRR